MARVQYFVVNHSGEWKISLNGTHHGPYATQKAGGGKPSMSMAERL